MRTCELDKVSEVMAKEGCSFKKSWNVAGAEGSNEEHDETTKKPCNTTEMNARMPRQPSNRKFALPRARNFLFFLGSNCGNPPQ